MRIVSAAKHAALETRLQRTTRDLEAAEKQSAERLATIRGLRTELEQLRDAKPATPLPQPPAPVGDVELRHQLALARRTIRKQAALLDVLQVSNEADTRELHDLRQGVTS